MSTSDTNGYTTTYAGNGANVYLSVQDNASTASAALTTNDATVTLQTTLTLVVGRTYTFSFTVASQHGSNSASTSQLQLLDIQFNGVSSGKYTTQDSTTTTDSAKITRSTGYTLLATPTTGIGTQTISVSYTPTVASTTFRYLWTLPARRSSGGTTLVGGSDDIAISAPTITGC